MPFFPSHPLDMTRQYKQNVSKSIPDVNGNNCPKPVSKRRQYTRRKYTELEKLQVALVRKVKACGSCRRKKIKCEHALNSIPQAPTHNAIPLADSTPIFAPPSAEPFNYLGYPSAQYKSPLGIEAHVHQKVPTYGANDMGNGYPLQLSVSEYWSNNAFRNEENLWSSRSGYQTPPEEIEPTIGCQNYSTSRTEAPNAIIFGYNLHELSDFFAASTQIPHVSSNSIPNGHHHCSTAPHFTSQWMDYSQPSNP